MYKECGLSDCPGYSPDTQAMGDCLHCGHTAKSHDKTPKQYTIGRLTMKHVFEKNNIHNLNDLQLVMDAVEKAFKEYEGKNNV